MKTCSFRGAEVQPSTVGLFCGSNAPEQRYRMIACGEPSCVCCHPLNVDKRRLGWSVIDFESTSNHQFCKEYTTYLNCPAVIVLRFIDRLNAE
jgi:hypothetical protein